MKNTSQFYHENVTISWTVGEAAVISKWPVDVYMSSEVIAATHPALWVFFADRACGLCVGRKDFVLLTWSKFEFLNVMAVVM